MAGGTRTAAAARAAAAAVVARVAAGPAEAEGGIRRGEERRRPLVEAEEARREEVLAEAAAAARARGPRTHVRAARPGEEAVLRAAAVACVKIRVQALRLIDGVELLEGLPHRLISTQAAGGGPRPTKA